ncbi:hypothetical protein AVL62_12675 [Serinicoccus chungangensis]|uniref:MobA-like NTP transferase domain-containing protein n=1 Tax=Serinicoccus chungangensis TaxID=767452 RepID=A0A0W8I0F2_9MICO|nr:NTP transferase domain-containing protein [Serinicoccus chungangensis]KUG51097.1 hypothetical protein AVL62_12675 [Serinicoccus chungangensis]
MTDVEPGDERGGRDPEGGPGHGAHGVGGELPAVDLVVLAGGRGERLGGADKAALVVDGRTLLERVLDVDLGGRVVVVGDTPVPDGVHRTLEDPPGGGPVAGIAAGLDLLDGVGSAVPEAPAAGRGGAATPDPAPAAWVAVCAVDQPAATVGLGLLRDALPGADPSVDAVGPVDGQGRRQWLLAVYRQTALRSALQRVGQPRHAAMRTLVADLSWHDVVVGPEHLGDIDTWEDLRRWDP